MSDDKDPNQWIRMGGFEFLYEYPFVEEDGESSSLSRDELQLAVLKCHLELIKDLSITVNLLRETVVQLRSDQRDMK